MKRIVLIALYFLAFHSVAFGAIPNAESIPFLGIENVASNLKKTVFAVQIEGSSPDTWLVLGSGFFIKGEPNQHYLAGITCAHVIESAANKPIFIGMSTNKGYKRFKCDVVSTDKDADVAIIIPQKKDPNEINLLNTIAFTLETFEDANSLIEGRGVIIAGFPLGMGIELDKEYPVIRMGIVAQYTGRRTFFIDTFINPGNSGSPIVAVKFEQNNLLGMITSYKADSIQLFDENHRPVAGLPYNSGLARAVTASEIRKCIEKIKFRQ
jgi:S1-C subfamily serine protease